MTRFAPVLDWRSPLMTEKVVVLDRGNIEFLYPGDWSIAASKEGYLTLSDPSESCRLEVSYQKVPPPAAEIPVARLLERLLEQVPEAPSDVTIESQTSGNGRFAWTDYAYPSTDKRTGNDAEAHGRWLIGSNGLFQLLMTFYYWEDDSGWAVTSWSRVYETIQFGDGSTLTSPEEHWSMRRKH